MVNRMQTDKRILDMIARESTDDLRRRISEHRKYMREAKIKRRSFMNAGLSREEYVANKTLFALETELRTALTQHNVQLSNSGQP